jgi:bifunctional oligoribonuclease and PAP phosphatase NrnA
MNNQASISALLDLIRERDSFAITSHIRPDGDAIGSSLGLMHLLETMGKRATVVFVDEIPPNFHFLPGVDRISSKFPKADAAIFLECDSVARCSIDRSEFDRAQPMLTINIDHHRTGREFADFNWIDPEAAAVGAMVYDLAIATGVTITTSIADCLYAAILTDTGSFNYSGTAASTFAMAERLIQSGTSASEIARAIYACNPASKLRLLGIALSNLQIDEAVCWSYVTVEEMERVTASVEDCEGVANHLIGIAGIEAAVFLRELPGHNQFRLSLRSRGNVDVSKVAEVFGGGGHQSASGCSMEGSLSDVTGRVVGQLHAACRELPKQRVAAPTQPSTLLA